MRILRTPPNILKCNGLVFKNFTLDPPPTKNKKLLFVLKIINGNVFETLLHYL